MAALLLGAIGGFLLGRSSDDDDGQAVTNAPVNTGAVDQAAVDQSVDNVFKMLTDQAQQDGGIQTPTAYPNLDSLLGVLASSATPASSVDTGVQQADVDLLTADRDELAAEVATLQEQIEPLQEQLAEVEAERDDLQEMVESSGGTTSELQAKLDEQTDQIATLYSDVVAAQEGLDQAQGDLEGVQADLDAANAMLTDLNLLKLEDLAGQPAEKARAMAQANGWTLVEQVGEIGKGQPDTVIQQAPAPGTQMITGSVLYIEVSPKR